MTDSVSCSSASSLADDDRKTYHDFVNDNVDSVKQTLGLASSKRRGPRGGVVTPFPVRLYGMLQSVEKEGLDKIVCWQPHGRAFLVRRNNDFVTDVLPRYFKQTKITSFQRQLNLYGFVRISSGPDRGGYWHELFLRGRPDLCKLMLRTRVKGTNFARDQSHIYSEPNFYELSHCKAKHDDDGEEEEEYEANEDEEKIVTKAVPVTTTKSSLSTLMESSLSSSSPLTTCSNQQVVTKSCDIDQDEDEVKANNNNNNDNNKSMEVSNHDDVPMITTSMPKMPSIPSVTPPTDLPARLPPIKNMLQFRPLACPPPLGNPAEMGLLHCHPFRPQKFRFGGASTVSIEGKHKTAMSSSDSSDFMMIGSVSESGNDTTDDNFSVSTRNVVPMDYKLSASQSCTELDGIDMLEKDLLSAFDSGDLGDF